MSAFCRMRAASTSWAARRRCRAAARDRSSSRGVPGMAVNVLAARPGSPPSGIRRGGGAAGRAGKCTRGGAQARGRGDVGDPAEGGPGPLAPGGGSRHTRDCLPRRAGRRAEGGVVSEASDSRHGQWGLVHARGGAPPVTGALHSRGPRAHGNPHRVRHDQLRGVHGPPQRKGREVLHRPRGPGRRGGHPDRGRARPGRSASPHPGGILGGARAAVRLLHAGDDDDRAGPVAAHPQPHRGTDPVGDRREPVSVHGLPAHRERHSVRGAQNAGRKSAVEHPVRGESPMAVTRVFGASVKRREDPRLVTGRSTYTDDLQLPGMLHAQFVRSPHAHARILGIDVGAARRQPGVVAVLTGRDLQGVLQPIPTAWLIPNADLKTPPHPPLAVDTVRYVGDAVAVVVAEDRYRASDAAALVRVDYQVLPAVVDQEKAVQPGAPQLHPEAPQNVAFRWSVRGGDPDQAFAEARREGVVLAQRFVNQRLIPNAMETRSVVARYNPGSGELVVWYTTQNPHIARFLMSVVTGLPEHKIRIIAPEVGGGFGSKIPFYPEEAVIAHCSRVAGRPVKWTEDRRENYLATIHGRDHITDLEVAARRDGTLLATWGPTSPQLPPASRRSCTASCSRAVTPSRTLPTRSRASSPTPRRWTRTGGREGPRQRT